jgi:hypothetical protein
MDYIRDIEHESAPDTCTELHQTATRTKLKNPEQYSSQPDLLSASSEGDGEAIDGDEAT